MLRSCWVFFTLDAIITASSANCSQEQVVVLDGGPHMYPRHLNSGLGNVFMRVLKQRLNIHVSGEHGSPCKTISWLVHSFFTATKIDDPWYVYTIENVCTYTWEMVIIERCPYEVVVNLAKCIFQI